LTNTSVLVAPILSPIEKFVSRQTTLYTSPNNEFFPTDNPLGGGLVVAAFKGDFDVVVDVFFVAGRVVFPSVILFKRELANNMTKNINNKLNIIYLICINYNI
jgi:hypothetical protein